jgi:hypothetical protein
MNAESGAPRLTDREFLGELLRERVFKSGNSPAPASIAKLASRLRGLRVAIEARKVAVQRDREQQQKIRAALDVLIELLPDARKAREGQEASAAATRYPQGPTVQDAITTIDTLNSAAVYARTNLVFGPDLILFSPWTEEWKDSAKTLDTVFNETLGEQPRDATYRFIQEIVPYLTGESPGYDAVRSALMRGRLVNRGKSKRPLP